MSIVLRLKCNRYHFNKQGDCEQDIGNRICKARTVFMKLKKILVSNIYSLQTKVSKAMKYSMHLSSQCSFKFHGCVAWRVNEAEQ